jgi:hypothetical protein
MNDTGGVLTIKSQWGSGEDIQFRRELVRIGSSSAPINLSQHHVTSRYITLEGGDGGTTTVWRNKEGD